MNRNVSVLGQMVSEALLAAQKRTISLGAAGKVKAANLVPYKNDLKVVGDVESEAAMLEIVQDYARKHTLYVQVFTEEHGTVFIGENTPTSHKITVALDGIDGTGNYANSDAPFSSGPMFSVMEGLDPRYCDTLAAGALSLNDGGWMVLADKETGQVFFTEVAIGDTQQLAKFDSQSTNPATWLSDDYTSICRKKSEEVDLKVVRTGSTAVTAMLLALQNTARFSSMPSMNAPFTALCLDAGDKGNLEQPVLWLFANLLGGVMRDSNNQDIGQMYFKEWSQASEEIFYCAPNEATSKEIRKLLHL